MAVLHCSAAAPPVVADGGVTNDHVVNNHVARVLLGLGAETKAASS